jgi:hypothetical protein
MLDKSKGPIRSPTARLLISDTVARLRFTGMKASLRSTSKTETKSTFPVVSPPSSPPS